MLKRIQGWRMSWVALPLLLVLVFLLAGMGPGGKQGGYEYAILSFDESLSSSERTWTIDYPDKREVLAGGAKEMRFELKISAPVEEIRDRHILNALGARGWKLTATARTELRGMPRTTIYLTRIR